ncbi:MAG: hypothetical protein A2X37_11450 [Elusimicrobia bacterium GWA2_66_18]|nr:MAG: hypothetical protein A2X37_11450 [Elusimicrobia bacterium GWA2_66_18]
MPLTAALVALASLPALAIRPTAESRSEARRFGLNRLEKIHRRAPSARSQSAFSAFNASEGGHWKIRYDARTGNPFAVVGGRTIPRPGRPEAAARAFLNAHAAMLGVETANLTDSRQTTGDGHRHVLYRQNYRGIPVEFASVKVHLDEQGSVLGAHSTYEPDLNIPTTPALAAEAAARAAELDSHGKTLGSPELVILPVETTGRAHLAWKVKVQSPGAAWRYYLDAMTGQVLFRYNNLRFACLTSGTVDGMVYDVDPSTTPGPVGRHFNHQYVYIGSNATRVETREDATSGQGYFCGTATGKVVMSLQGPFVNVAQFTGPSAHFDNGSGAWSSVATPVASPHPYPNSSVLVSTIDLTVAAPAAVKFLPFFSSFRVGGFSGSATEGGDITDDDQMTLYNQYDEPVANYIGNRGAFRAAAVHGKKMHLALMSNESGQEDGYDVAVSSFLTLTDADTQLANSSHTWVPADTSNSLRSEINLFYHLNLMHDYFFGDVNKSSAAPVVRPVVAMAHVGPNMINAFYNPDYDNLFFGDVSQLSPSDLFTDDATVSHHEYVHYLVEKIWPIQNFGQAGAISEGFADYFSASSLDRSSIGSYVCSSGFCGDGVSVLRELDSVRNGVKVLSAGTWAGEIHDDSIFFSQALWDIRRDRIQNLGYANGRSCADGLVFQSLLFFPESFQEFQDALLRVDQLGRVTACGTPNSNQGFINAAFNAHGLTRSGDAYEPNDGFSSAVDISTLSSVAATIYPTADADFWSFGAGPGLVEATLDLPRSDSFYKGYQLKLFDRSRRQVAASAPPYNGFGTIDGFCDVGDCTTTASSVRLSYNNPAGGLLYLQVVGGDSLNGSASGVNSTTPYALKVVYPRSGALSGGIISAAFDSDVISFVVDVSTFISNQDWRFDHAQLRNQSFAAMQNTATSTTSAAGSFLLLVSTSNSAGRINGQVRLAPGFASRFPSAGTVYLEVFGYNASDSAPAQYSVDGSTHSLGLSNPINLTSSQPELTAYNNLFNPLRAEKATVKYAVNAPGRLTLKLYTITGAHVLTLFDDVVPAGKGSVDWDGRNLNGNVVASGIYLIRAEGPGINKTQKIAIIK